MNDEIDQLAHAALNYITEGMVVGLGSGRASTAFIEALGEKVNAGFAIQGVPTSLDSEKLGKSLGIPIVHFDVVATIDVAVDGADEIDPAGNLIKGYGGAMVREKIVAQAAKQFIILAGSEKHVPILGSRGIIPVEVIPFGLHTVSRRLQAIGLIPKQRMRTEGEPYVTDNGNFVLDCGTETMNDPASVEQAICSIPGVLGTGLFLGMKPIILMPQS
jgi:ribose 5-phosphate isomerase A